MWQARPTPLRCLEMTLVHAVHSPRSHLTLVAVANQVGYRRRLILLVEQGHRVQVVFLGGSNLSDNRSCVTSSHRMLLGGAIRNVVAGAGAGKMLRDHADERTAGAQGGVPVDRETVFDPKWIRLGQCTHALVGGHQVARRNLGGFDGGLVERVQLEHGARHGRRPSVSFFMQRFPNQR